MNDQQDPPEQKAPEQPQQTEAAVPEPEPVAAAEAQEPEPTPEAIEAEVEAPPVEEETEQPEAALPVSAEQVPAEAGCPVLMHGVRRCRRAIHYAPAGVDEEPVCLMHSKDPAKSDEEFQEEFERILAAAGDGVADFTGFVFPSAAYQDRGFAAHCIFKGAMFRDLAVFVGATFTRDAHFFMATFTEDADFSGAKLTLAAGFTGATFTQRAFFRGATFTQGAGFVGARFMRHADFRGATFTQEAVFHGATFTQDADFSEATFTQDADFREAKFTQRARFDEATFTQDADFMKATFTKDADFYKAAFTQDAYFFEATFTKDAVFLWAKFTQSAYFYRAEFSKYATFVAATFMQGADFSGATFAGASDFRHAVFGGTARFAPSAKSEGEEAKPCEFKNRALFQDARFQDYADFREAVFGEPGNSTVRPVFSLARFEKSERVTFYKTWLGQTLFVNCDVSKVNFSDVEWGRCGSRRQLYEETVPLDDEAAEPLKPPAGKGDKRNYRLIAETYHQLKKNYDSSGDPWRANDFHYGEMEMLRRSSRWPRVGLTALYRHASLYGLSMARPLAWLAGVLLLLTLLYPLAGLRPVAARTQAALPVTQVKPITYWNLPEATGWVPRPLRLLGHSFMTTLAVASLQREAAYYEPAYGLGRFLGILELALTSTLAALFILAVRRQFKRGGD